MLSICKTYPQHHQRWLKHKEHQHSLFRPQKWVCVVNYMFSATLMNFKIVASHNSSLNQGEVIKEIHISVLFHVVFCPAEKVQRFCRKFLLTSSISLSLLSNFIWLWDSFFVMSSVQTIYVFLWSRTWDGKKKWLVIVWWNHFYDEGIFNA